MLITVVENESNMSLITTPNSGNTYYFRSRIPTDLIEHFGGLTEFRVSLICAVDHKNKMFQIMIKILVCMYILIFYSNNVFSKTNKNILNKTNFQIQVIIISNLGSGLGLSYKLNNNL